MKILLLTVHAEFEVKHAGSIGIHRIAQYLRRHDIFCDVCEIGLEPHEPFLKKALNGEYAVIGVSSTYFFIKQELEAIAPFYEAKKRHPCLFIAGGNSPSLDDDLWLDLGFDAVIRGYGERPMLAVAQALNRSPGQTVEALAAVAGLSYRHGNATIRVPAEPLTEEVFYELNYTLEQELVATRKAYPTIFPEIKGDFFPEIKKKYALEEVFTDHSINLYTSHQCPNRCGYCCSSRLLEKTYGGHSAFSIGANQIYDLIRSYFQNRKVTFFSFWDDDFCASRSRVKTFCRLVIEGKGRGEIPQETKFQCQTRVLAFRHRREVDTELLELMHEAGFILISLGVENFSKRLLHMPVMSKFGYDETLAMELIRAIIAHGMCPSINFMMCVPEARPEEILLNIKKLIELQQMFISVNIGFYIDAYPGAPVYSDPRYPAIKRIIYNPLIQKKFVKKTYLIPHNPVVRNALKYYMKEGVRLELAAVAARFGVDFPVNKDVYLMNLLKCRAFAKALPNSQEIMRELEAAIEKRSKRIFDIHQSALKRIVA